MMGDVIEFKRPDLVEFEQHSIVHPEKDKFKVLNGINEVWCETNIGGKTGYHNGVQFIGGYDFKARYANEFIQFETIGRDGSASSKLSNISTEWLCWKNKRTAVNGMTFNLNLPVGVTECGHYNLWSGFSVQPIENERIYDVFKAHVTNVIANGDEILAKYVLDWCAFGFQNPAKPIGVALVLRGKKGVGKGLFGTALKDLWGKHSMHITSSNTLVGQFNSHLVDKPFIFADEAMFAGDRKGEQVLKGLITETSMAVETKGYPIFMADTAFKILMCTNSDFAVPATSDERRFCVMDVSESKLDDDAYFTALRAVTESNEGLAAILWGLLNRDLSGVNIRSVPETEALKEQRGFNLTTAAKFMVYFSQSGLNDSILWQGELPSKALYDSYVNWAKDVRLSEYHHITQDRLTKYLKKLGLKPYTTGSTRGWSMGSAASLVKRIEKLEKINLSEFSDYDEEGMELFDDD